MCRSQPERQLVEHNVTIRFYQQSVNGFVYVKVAEELLDIGAREAIDDRGDVGGPAELGVLL